MEYGNGKLIYTQDEWFHEIMSFVILLCNLTPSSSGKTTICKNENGIYCANLMSGELPFDRAKDLYSAFVWFHSHLEEYAEKLAEAHQKKNTNFSFAHVYFFHDKSLKIGALLEMPRVCMKKSKFALGPKAFYMLFLKAYKQFSPDLYILDLTTDLNNRKAARARIN